MKNKFILDVTYRTFNNYFSDNPDKNVNVIKNFLIKDNTVQLLHIQSDIGNGGTHLLKAAGNFLMNKNYKIALINGERLSNLELFERNEFDIYLENRTCFLIEGIHGMNFLKDKTSIFPWLRNTINNFIKKGGKLIIESSKDVSTAFLCTYFNLESSLNVSSEYPSRKVLLKLAKCQFEEKTIEEHFEEVYMKTTSVRLFLNYLFMFEVKRLNGTNFNQSYMEMDSQPIVSKIEILKLKLQLAELQEEIVQLLQKQNFLASTKVIEKRTAIYSQLGILKYSLQNQLLSLERSPLNYPLIHEIHTILLEFNEEDLKFRTAFFNEMDQLYDDLGIKWKELQQSGDFINAKEVNVQRVDIGKFIGKIPN